MQFGHTTEVTKDTRVIRIADAAPEAASGELRADFALPDVLQLEGLILNLDAALRVHTRPHFFSWTQGILQSLVRHEVLVCALRNGQPLSFRAEAYSTHAANAGAFSDAFAQDTGAAPNLVRGWEENGFRPLAIDLAEGGPFAAGALARELARIGASRVLVHGTHDPSGQAASLFVFASQPATLRPRQDYFAELVVPAMHVAWLRTQLVRNEGGAGPKAAAAANPLTAREKEILGWIYLGKSNYEIGAILKISPLTVKNHVQKILRKLDVVNRTQAIGKALELRILNT
ncbi:MAG TPA: XrtB/PEP-CTERM-associated transcriptional regulator EpsA [Burkholderiales bacterium]|jgi:transcriptional regulator EpsA|nr:XrtB/PEP-CTERM-associated transcriptional regulator EpsA [Burkholderiales bacterium]